jgi:hypothetical protein
VEKVLNRFCYSECSPAPTPYDHACLWERIGELHEINWDILK